MRTAPPSGDTIPQNNLGQAILLVILAVILIAGYFLDAQWSRSPDSSVAGPLAQARKQHATLLERRGSSPQSYSNALPDGARLVTYRSPAGELRAWLGEPKTPGRHPGLLYCHCGLALGKSDFDEVRQYIEAGYVVLEPAWRGENGNPGDCEMLYGEVDDARAALTKLAALPDVDPNRLFAAGSREGATLAFLLAECDTRLRAAAVCSPFPDIQSYYDHAHLAPPGVYIPYRFWDSAEGDLRSPGRHLADLHCPLWIYDSLDDPPGTRGVSIRYGTHGRILTNYLPLDQDDQLPDRARALGKRITCDRMYSATRDTLPGIAAPLHHDRLLPHVAGKVKAARAGREKRPARA